MDDTAQIAGLEADAQARRRHRNRLALIGAALELVAETGVSQASADTIAARLGQPPEVIERHFGGEMGLIEAAAAQFADSYYEAIDRALAEAGNRPQQRIEAILRGDLGEETLNPRNVGLWYAFRGAARERAAIAAICKSRDAGLRSMVQVAFLELARAEGFAEAEAVAVARDATSGLLAFLEGMWSDYLRHPDQFDREDAARAGFRFLAALFPRHFSLGGAI